MSAQLGLDFAGNPPATPVRDRGEGRRISAAALDSLDLPRLEGAVLEALQAFGCGTMDELATWLQEHRAGLSAWTCATMSGRLNGLGRRGLAFRRGTRPGRSGRNQAVWWPRP